MTDIKDWNDVRAKRKDNKARKLALSRPARAADPKCPARSKNRLAKLRAAGDTSHDGNSHYCEKCACQNTAGFHTDHPGVGFCWKHERLVTPEVADEVAFEHAQALQTHSPFRYQNAGAWLERVKQEGQASQKLLDLTAEIEAGRALIQQVMEHMRALLDVYREGGVDASGDMPNGVTVDEGGMVRIYGLTLDQSLHRVNQLLGTLSRLGLAKRSIESDDVITRGELKAFVAGWISVTQQAVFDESTDRQAVWNQWIHKIKAIGEPVLGRR